MAKIKYMYTRYTVEPSGSENQMRENLKRELFYRKYFPIYGI